MSKYNLHYTTYLSNKMPHRFEPGNLDYSSLLVLKFAGGKQAGIKINITEIRMGDGKRTGVYLRWQGVDTSYLQKLIPQRGWIKSRICPASAGFWPDVFSILDQRLRRWPSIETTSGESPVSSGFMNIAPRCIFLNSRQFAARAVWKCQVRASLKIMLCKVAKYWKSMWSAAELHS